MDVSERKAPKGEFRVVHVDSFPWPYEESLSCDVPTIEIARVHAAALSKPYSYGVIYNDAGEEVV